MKFKISLQAWQALPLASQAIHQALKEDLTLRGTAKIGEDTEYKKISDLNLAISDDVIEDIKVNFSSSIYFFRVFLQFRERRENVFKTF